jgi:hypothetical protein
MRSCQAPKSGMALTDERTAVRVFRAEAAEAAATEAVTDIVWMTGPIGRATHSMVRQRPDLSEAQALREIEFKRWPAAHR